MARSKRLKRADRRQPEPMILIATDLVLEKSSTKPFIPHNSTITGNQSLSNSKASRKRGHVSKSSARSKLEKGVEKADRLRAKASKRMQQAEKKKRAKEF